MVRVGDIKCWGLYRRGDGWLRYTSGVPVTYRTKREALADTGLGTKAREPRRLIVRVIRYGR